MPWVKFDQTNKKMNELHESIISNCFYLKYVLYSMYNKKSEDFVEVLSTWAKVIGVNLER